MAGKYRKGVGIMLINRAGLVFVAQRIDVPFEAWQMPQGGIDKGEAPLDAAFREMEEEIGTARAEVIGETPGWLRYDLPDELRAKLWKGKYVGQKQKWYAMRFLGDDSDITLETAHPEFREWKWAPVSALTEMIIPFKRPLYEQVVADLAGFAVPVEG